MSVPPGPLDPRKPSRIWVTLLIALAGNAAVFALSINLYSVPAGAAIRPMGWAFGTAVNVIRRARAQMRSSRRYFLPWLAIILSLLPYPLSDFMLHNAARTRGFFLEL